jgi:hypothetical protein
LRKLRSIRRGERRSHDLQLRIDVCTASRALAHFKASLVSAHRSPLRSAISIIEQQAGVFLSGGYVEKGIG